MFFGNLGENCSELVSFFEAGPDVSPIVKNINPATWMLEVIGAGTSGSASVIDFPLFYDNSELCAVNKLHIDALCSGPSPMASRDDHDEEMGGARRAKVAVTASTLQAEESQYNTTYNEQLSWLFKRAMRSYWRSPSYNITRFAINVVIALIFASAYANQTYYTDVNVISRSAVIYITVFFCGVVGMQNVLPVAFADRYDFPSFVCRPFPCLLLRSSSLFKPILNDIILYLLIIPIFTYSFI